MITKNEMVKLIKERPFGFMCFALTLAVFSAWVLGLSGYQNLTTSFNEVMPILILAILSIVSLNNGD